jgi:hypothetical protein
MSESVTLDDVRNLIRKRASGSARATIAMLNELIDTYGVAKAADPAPSKEDDEPKVVKKKIFKKKTK